MRKGKDLSSWPSHAQGVSCVSHTAVILVQCQPNKCWIYGGRSVTGKSFSSNTSNPVVSVTTHSFISHRPRKCIIIAIESVVINNRNTQGSNI